MKSLMIIGTLLSLSTAAQAAGGPMYCETNVRHDVRQPTTTFTLSYNPAGTTFISVRTMGGMAHFVTAPQTFPVAVQARGPEVVEYFNAKEDFELTVVYQLIGGQIRGTFTGEIMGRRVQTPVLCYMPRLWKI
jgi:hypothetical protein